MAPKPAQILKLDEMSQNIKYERDQETPDFMFVILRVDMYLNVNICLHAVKALEEFIPYLQKRRCVGDTYKDTCVHTASSHVTHR
jgi:hypothetical protein